MRASDLVPHLVAALLALPIALVFGCRATDEEPDIEYSWAYRLSVATARASYGASFAVGDRVPLRAVAIQWTTECDPDSTGCDPDCESWSREYPIAVLSASTSRADCAV